ncbi:MAG TPA: HDOD domain-containing protein [Bryobacteraceae bacterium]|nr:HDOD domain-containing protein [Bryobacteraceae bacterium]
MARSADAVSLALKKVPPFPPVAAKLLQLLSNSAVDLGEVSEMVESDASFTARLLQRVNSAEFGLLAPVTSIRQAVALLGIDLTKQVVITHATATYVEAALRTEQLRRCWEHTVATAVLAREVAEACQAHTQSAFTAGIMHDIGRLGLLVAYPDDYERILRDAAERCLDLLDFEQEEFGLDHAAAGRVLAEQWGLPAEFGVVAGRHHDPLDGSALDLLQVVHVACRLADALGYDVVKPLLPIDTEAVIGELPLSARERLRIDVAELRSRIQEQMSRYSSAAAAPAPEVTLAMLAPSDPEQSQEFAPPAEPSPPGDRQQTAKAGVRWPLIALLAAGLLALTIIFLWRP